MKELTEYEIQKAQHKRLLVRNEFRGVGKYDIPLVRKQYVAPEKLNFWILPKPRWEIKIMQTKRCIFLCTIGNSIKSTIIPMPSWKS